MKIVKTFDLSIIPIEALDKSYVRYEPYNLGITFRHPLRRVTKNAEFKRNPEEAKSTMLSTYPLSDEQFIIQKGHDGTCVAILSSFVENNAEVIENAMLKLGFLRSKLTNDKILVDSKGRKWIDLRFEST